ncbi:MAG: BrnA antitoxin family protein [Bdellovibrionaceae bacterium]|nr:BrnA antitoxin family protein [Pseudobdellovibrionaceae bacterium]
MPEVSAEKLKKFKRVGRPLLGSSPRVPITIRIEKEVLQKIKTEAKRRSEKYQSFIHRILKQAV